MNPNTVKGCRRAPLFTAPADAARHKRCDGRFYRSRLASVTVYAGSVWI
ncbi:hypothetical protein [Escherichia coli]|nr:hypothetical protein [Escherichia coli]